MLHLCTTKTAAAATTTKIIFLIYLPAILILHELSPTYRKTSFGRTNSYWCREKRTKIFYKQCQLSYISIYTLSDLGDLSNLIGSLSRTIQQYSPPNEWIMCELGVFPIFLENDLLKVDKILGPTFLRQEKTRKDSMRRFSIYCSWVLCSMDCLQLPRIRVKEAELSVF